MAETATMEPSASEAAQLMAEIKQAFAEMDLLREQIRRDNQEIERSRVRTQAILDSLNSMFKEW
jgi:hypothetical protein